MKGNFLIKLFFGVFVIFLFSVIVTNIISIEFLTKTTNELYFGFLIKIPFYINKILIVNNFFGVKYSLVVLIISAILYIFYEFHEKKNETNSEIIRTRLELILFVILFGILLFFLRGISFLILMIFIIFPGELANWDYIFSGDYFNMALKIGDWGFNDIVFGSLLFLISSVVFFSCLYTALCNVPKNKNDKYFSDNARYIYPVLIGHFDLVGLNLFSRKTHNVFRLLNFIYLVFIFPIILKFLYPSIFYFIKHFRLSLDLLQFHIYSIGFILAFIYFLRSVYKNNLEVLRLNIKNDLLNT